MQKSNGQHSETQTNKEVSNYRSCLCHSTRFDYLTCGLLQFNLCRFASKQNCTTGMNSGNVHQAHPRSTQIL